MLKSVEQRLLIALLVMAISGGVVMYREVGELKAVVFGFKETLTSVAADNREGLRQMNGRLLNYERRGHEPE